MLRNRKYYMDCFSSLNTMKKNGLHAPHKALLLMSVIDLIEQGIITDSRIYLSDKLIHQFKLNTSLYVGKCKLFQPQINYPYFHLRSEPFWRLKPMPGVDIDEISNYSVSNLRKKIAFAVIDLELFELLQSSAIARKTLRTILVDTYINNQHTLSDNLPLILFTFGTLATLIA